jgi:hypothetical protein
MCARHWRMVPKPLQAAIYESWRRDGCAGENHREALRLVNETESGRASLGLPAGMKALTVWQPWASLIMMGAKPHEFRRWNFADKPHLAKLIGRRIVVHAGARPARISEIDDVLARIEDGESALEDHIAKPFLLELREAIRRKERGNAPLASALGTAVLGEPRNVLDLFGDGQVGDSDRLDQHMYGWPLSDVQPFTAPVPAAGAQGFWNWS